MLQITRWSVDKLKVAFDAMLIVFVFKDVT